MTRNNKATVYTQLDEQRYKLWIQRLENSIKNYLELSNDETIIQKETLLKSIEDTVRKELEMYPSWISLQRNIHPVKLASSSNEMKTFLRHICFPHVMESYHKLIEEISSSFNSENSSSSSSSIIVTTNSSIDSDANSKVDSNKLLLPIQTAPVYFNSNARDTTVHDFFTSISSGKDGIVNLCKLADINHRIFRANVHDNQQITQWIENELIRKDNTAQNIELRNQKLQYLRGNDENKFIENSVGFLKSEIEVLYNHFTQAEDEEEKARKMYEAAVQKRRQAGQNLSNLENFIVNVSDQQQLLQKVNEFRLEADLYNMNSAENRVKLFSGIEKYVKSVQSNFIQNRLSFEIPQLFDNLVNSFKQAQISMNSNIDDSPSKDSLSLSCAARVGLETIRIWKQLELTNGNPLLDKSIEDFKTNLLSLLHTCPLPQPVDKNAQDIYRVTDSTVVLFFDHLCHDTPEDHVEAQSRVSTCLKMLMDRIVDDNSNAMDNEVKKIRSMVVLNCNDVISPPVWCLPLAHSPQYLSQLWSLAAAARKDDLYVPLEFDTEWISEDPYHTSSDEESFHAAKSSQSRSSVLATIGLMRSVDVEPSWSTSFTDKEKFHELLTPADTDHIVAKVIAKMEQKAAAKNTRNQKIAATKTKTEKESNAVIMRKDTSINVASNDSTQVDNSTDHNDDIPSAILGDETIVRTPFGNGKVIETYRTDKLISVQLTWGAVGHFNKDSIYYLGLTPAANILKKTEKPYYSAAQAFYVSGSGGRFAHTNMQMHNLLSRIVTIVRVQRVIGDLVGVAHANLSLYMHGRTSSGLTKSIETNVTKWIESFDLNRMLSLIEKAEKTESEGKGVDIDKFLRELEFTGKLPSSVAPNIVSTQPPPVKIESKKRSQNLDNLVLSTISNVKEEVIIKNIPSKKESIDLISTAELQIEKQSSYISSPKPSPLYKSYDNLTFSSKYSLDGEILRDVMLVIIQKLKMSQSSLSNEYYRCFRYETSAAGVTAWFNFRGNNATFEHLNHCALMWVEDRKSYLSIEDQIRFDEINRRMSQISSNSSELNEIQETNDDDDDNGAQINQEMKVLLNKNDYMHNDILMEIDEVRNNADEVIDTSYHNFNDKNQFKNIATTEDYLINENDQILSSNTLRINSSEEDINSIGDSYTMSEEVLMEDSNLNNLNESALCTIIDYSAAKYEEHHLVTTNVLEDIKPNDVDDEVFEGGVENSNQDDNVDDDQNENGINNNNDENDNSSNESNLESEKETMESDIKDDEISVNQQDENLRETSESQINTKSTKKIRSDVITDSKVVLNKIRTINDLHAALSFEMNRRKVSQSRVATEAKQIGLSVGQPALSKFLSVASIKNNERGKQFSEYMLKWIKWSMSESSAEDWEPNQKVISVQSRKRIETKPPTIIKTHESQNRFKPDIDDRDVKTNLSSKSEKYMHCKVPNPKGGMNCGLCGMHSDDFSNMKCFHMHLAWCYHRRDSGKGVTTNQNEASNKRKLNISEDESNKKLRSNSVDSSAKFPYKLNIDDPFKDKLILVPDTFKSGMHYETCDVCKEQGDLILCDTCPCVLHSRCIDIDTSASVNGKWYCMKCQESGASTASILSTQKKLAKDIVNTWILTYSSALRCWRKSVVLTVHPEKKNVLLVKWWRVDSDGYKTNWLDISKATVLVATAERAGAASNRAQIQQIALLKERRSNVRFTESFDNNDRRSLNNRFKENDRPLLMDGESDMSVPPLVRAAASGVGGISALRDDEYMDEKTGNINISGNGMSDTYISSNSLKAALCASGSACKAVDIAICSQNTNVFACIRPPGHHAGRYGCTSGCLSTGFCLLNNAAIAAIYGRVRWGLERVAVVDIDVHFGNGTAELLRNDPNAFFASVHMIYGEDNDGLPNNIKVKQEQNDTTTPIKKTRPSQSLGFYPARLGTTEVTDNYVSVGVYPPQSNNKKGNTLRKKKKVVVYDSDSSESIVSVQNSDDEVECKEEDTSKNEDQNEIVHTTPDSINIKPMDIIDSNENTDNILKDDSFIGAEGFIKALRDVVIPKMEKFRPQLLVISAGFDGYVSDPLGGQLCLSLEDYKLSTKLLMDCMERIKATEKDSSLITGKVISLLEGGYDTSPFTLGLAKCVDAHVQALQEG